MRTLLGLSILVAAVAAPIAAQNQPQPKWEYGRLHLAVGDLPVGWSAGDSSGNAKALMKAVDDRDKAGTRKNSDPLVGVLNVLAEDGWEVVQVIPGNVFLRRRKE